MKKQVIRLTESDLHRIIRKSVNKIIREAEGLDADEYFDEYWHREHGNADDYLKPYGKMPEGYDDDVDIDTADMIAGLNTNDESEIYPYLKGIENKASWSAFDADRNYRMDGGDEPYDSYAYQGERKPTLGELGNFNVHESRINRIIKESVKKILRETDCAGVMQTGSGNAPKGTNPEAGQYTVPFGADKDTADRTPGKVAMGGKAKWNVNNGNVQRREIYNPKSGKKKLGESMYDDDWSNYEDGLDYLYDKYSEDYGREDPTYQMQKNDYNGIISMLKQYGYNAEIEDNDPEGEYPPVLTVIENPYRRRRFGIDKLTKFLENRGWKLDNQYSGERTKKGIIYMFRKNM